MKKIYLAAAALMALSQSASAISCYFGCKASACGSSQETFSQCWNECKGTVNADGSLSGSSIGNCIKAAQKAPWFGSFINAKKAEVNALASAGQGAVAPSGSDRNLPVYDVPAPRSAPAYSAPVNDVPAPRAPAYSAPAAAPAYAPARPAPVRAKTVCEIDPNSYDCQCSAAGGWNC